MKPSCKKVLKLLKHGWISNFQLVYQTTISAMERVRELRAMGYPVIKRRVERNGKMTNTYEYKIRGG